jgi:uncharacterized membrane protein YczE
MTRRLTQLFLGLGLYGFSMAMMIEAALGLDPWDVFHQGVFEHVGGSFGLIVNLVGALCLLLWIPLRQRPGIGTIANILVIGTVADISLYLLPTPETLIARSAWMTLSILLQGVASGAYIGAGLGPGPRDGLMTGIVRRTGWPLRLVRTAIEVTVLGLGWVLGGTVGIGTLLYAIGIGPLIHLFLPLFAIDEQAKAKPAAASP